MDAEIRNWGFCKQLYIGLPGTVFIPNSKNKKSHSEKISYFFLEKRFSYISGNGTF